MDRPHDARKSHDEGFTLVEAIAVIGMRALISTVIAGAIVVIFRGEDGIVRLTSESHDTQQGVNYFPLDIQAGPLAIAAYDTSPGAAGCVAEGDNVLQFDKGDKRVAYRLMVSGEVGRLDRHICDLPGLTNLERVNVADRLDGAAPQPAVATLIPAAGVLVDSIELRLAQDRTDALVVASPRSEPRNSPGDCQTNNPIDAAHGYGTFVEGDVELRDGAITGWLGLGGTLTWLNDITVASGSMSGVSPAYGLYAEGINWAAIIRAGARAVADLDVSSNVATVTVATHGYATGQQVIVEATGNSDIDGNAFVITVIDADTFTFPVTTSSVNDLTGTARLVAPVVLKVAKEKPAIGGPFVQVGDLVYQAVGSTDNHLDVSGPPATAAESTAAQIDFPLDFDELRDCSAQLAQLLDICGLAGCANEVTVTVSPPVVNACSSSPVPQVLNIPEQYFDGTWQFDTSGPGCQGFSQTRPLILNVIDDGDGTINFDATPVDWTALGDRKNILYNFPNATVVNITSAFVDCQTQPGCLHGHVTAPFAQVTTNGNIAGGIIARQWTHINGTVDSNDDLFDNTIAWP